MENYPELDKVHELIQQAIKSYIILIKVGKHQEAEMVKAKIREMKLAQKNLQLVMNLDFDKPSQKMIDMAKEANIDLKDETIMQEFKLIQKQNLEDINRMRKG